jgi:hypothetical protein
MIVSPSRGLLDFETIQPSQRLGFSEMPNRAAFTGLCLEGSFNYAQPSQAADFIVRPTRNTHQPFHVADGPFIERINEI